MSLTSLSHLRENYSAYDWKDLWDFDRTYGQNILEIINRTIYLPDSDIQSKIVACYACQNTVLLNKSFILYLHGLAGTGKSTLGKLIAFFHDSPVWSSGSTSVSIRNYLQSNQYLKVNGVKKHFEGKPIERSILLVWDDIDESMLQTNYFYQLMKTSVDRKTAVITTSGESLGKNNEYSVFSSKVLSSCFLPFKNSDYSEFNRRTLFIRCEQADRHIEVIDLDSISWDGIYDEFIKAWNHRTAEKYFFNFKRLKKPNGISNNEWECSKTLIPTGIAQGIFADISEGYEVLSSYWNSHHAFVEANRPEIEKLLQVAIDNWHKRNEGRTGQYVMTSYIDDYLKAKIKNGELSNIGRFNVKQRTQAMHNLGYELRLIHSINFWVRK